MIANSFLFWWKVKSFFFFFFLFPSFVMALEWHLGPSSCFVINPESEGAERQYKGKQNIYRKDRSPLKGGYRKASRHSFALK